VSAKDRLQEVGSSRAGRTRRRAAVSVHARCTQTIWNMTVTVGVMMSGTAVLLTLVIDQSIQLHLISALILATVPAAATLVVGAVMVTVLRILAITYDVIRTLFRAAMKVVQLIAFAQRKPLRHRRNALTIAGTDQSRHVERTHLAPRLVTQPIQSTKSLCDSGEVARLSIIPRGRDHW
jgi:hypothetical protein